MTLGFIALASHNIGPIITALRTAQYYSPSDIRQIDICRRHNLFPDKVVSMRLSIVFITLLSICSLSFQLIADTLIFRKVTLLDPSKESLTQGDLVVANGKVISISKKAPPITGARIIEAEKKFIIPGLVDMHVHSSFGNPGIGWNIERLPPVEASRRYLYCGVTAFLDLLGDEQVIFEARKELKGSSHGARMFAAGPMFTAPGGHGTEFGFPNRTISNAKSAQKEILDLSKKHPDVIKFSLDHTQDFKNLEPETLKAAITQAKSLKIPTIVHIGTWKDGETAINSGADIITHLAPEPIPESVVNLMKEKGTIEIPTMTYQIDFLNILEDRSILDSLILQKTVNPAVLSSYRNIDPSIEQVRTLAGAQAKNRANHFISLKRLYSNKIPLMAGTDSGDIGVFHGFSLHREMKIFQDAGFSAWDILKSATLAPKRLLKIPLGIHPQEEADFILLNSSPLSDIRNTQDINGIMFRGSLIERDKLIQPF